MKTTTTSFAAVALAGVAALALSACGGSSEAADASATGTTESGFPKVLRLGAIPAENSTDLAAGYEPIIAMLEAETGATVEVSQASDYAGVIEGLIADKVDLAFLGSFAYVIATHNDAAITPLGAVIEEKGAEPGYYSLGITQGDNAEIDGLEDFAGRSVCFVDPGSTSGFLYPSSGLIDAGVITSGTEKDLAAGVQPVFAGGHDASALAVAAGDCEAGFAMQSMVEDTLPAAGDLADGDLKEVWRSPKISGSLFVGNDALGAENIATLTTLLTEKANSEYLLSQGFCDGECLLTDEDAWGFAPAEDADYDGTREVCTLTKSDKCEG
ncbi:phosphonate transport system substrate-binding protein [Cellulosimicrobium cellulans]|uniref:Phosphate starvation-inducible protein PhoH n=1 Tax=Cellulosimicrobium cellulans TaxID=1710 RepID=A0A1Y0HTR2_CELCE|nr:phosphate/phosphite/phosphonate ABC transporter substrate-binding protein [Cellulosimicrobium cellulans]ARU51547.1 phosphate starvation-inducible protein PhoH [Cellulosimicrobium cellulans]MBM7818014.1 phosphonate transport system substrate-binding protein [Cellulosimicrobium cellulans]